MSEEIKTDYCIAGGGIAGVVLASKLANSGKKITVLEQGPRFTEEDRSNMLSESKESLNDYADYNDDMDAVTVIPHTSAPQGDQVAEWIKKKNISGSGLNRLSENDSQRKRKN